MRLDLFRNPEFQRGPSKLTEALWIVVQPLLIESWIPGSFHRAGLLRLFGAKIGRGVVIKPHVRIKFPWKLEIGDYSWIGEEVWIDNLDLVKIGPHCCLSQGVYLCTGSHDWKRETFNLITRPITLDDQVWLCAKSSVAPGVHVGQGAVLTMGGLAVTDLEPWKIYGGTPATALRQRPRQETEPEGAHHAE
jgi:putative colanic acid biosynthesis acetyltransferase WcaF